MSLVLKCDRKGEWQLAVQGELWGLPGTKCKHMVWQSRVLRATEKDKKDYKDSLHDIR